MNEKNISYKHILDKTHAGLTYLWSVWAGISQALAVSLSVLS